MNAAYLADHYDWFVCAGVVQFFEYYCVVNLEKQAVKVTCEPIGASFYSLDAS